MPFVLTLPPNAQHTDGALKLYARAIEAGPRSTATLTRYGQLLRSKGDIEGAEDMLNRAVGSNPESAEALGALAAFYHGVRKSAEVIAPLYERAIAADATHANNLSNSGLFLSDVIHDPRRAEEAYAQALAADPEHSNAAYNYAVLLDSAFNDKKRSRRMYMQCLDSAPHHAYATYNLAVLTEKMGDNVQEARRLCVEKSTGLAVAAPCRSHTSLSPSPAFTGTSGRFRTPPRTPWRWRTLGGSSWTCRTSLRWRPST